LPYNSLEELPDSVKDNLPHHAQEIFKEAFNSASEEYKEEELDIKLLYVAMTRTLHRLYIYHIDGKMNILNNIGNEFVERNISPGGSADLLGVTVFLHLAEQYMNGISI